MQLYTQAQLETKSLKELKQIAETLGAEPQGDARAKANWIQAILDKMPVKVEEAPVVEEAQLDTEIDTSDTSDTVEESAPSDQKVEVEAKTCADCPLFQAFDDGSGRGLCCGADRVAREHHIQTQDCLHLIEAHEQEELVPSADYPASCIKGNPGYGMGYEHPYWIDGWDILFEINMLQHGAEDMSGDSTLR